MLSPRAQQALSSVPAFRGLGEDDRKQVAGLVREVLLEKGRVVYHAGDDADALYLVASGAVDVLDGENTILRYGPGEIFGESVLLAGERRRVTTRIALDALLLVLSRAHLERLLELHPSLHERVAALLMRRLKATLQVALGVTRPQRSEIVALQGWRSGTDREAFVDALVGALEREVGRDVALLTVAPSRDSSAMPGRRNRPDGVVVGEASGGGAAGADRLGAGPAGRAGAGGAGRGRRCPGGRGARPHAAGGHRARS